MNTAPAASVVIPALNAEATLGDLLLALKSQGGSPGPFEIIVVDNGSRDRTAEIARDHQVSVLHQPVRGPSAARNMGLRHARGEIVLCTDSDCVPTRRWLMSLRSTFADGRGVLATGPILGWQPITAAERYASSHKGFTRERCAEHPVHPFAHGMNVAVRRQAALEIGGWDETMSSGEDVDFAIRLRKRFGSSVHFVEPAVLFHKHRATDEALWRQARWHGAGYALVHQRHPDLLHWNPWRSRRVRGLIRVLHAGAPFIRVARALRLISAQREEFERYHRDWMREFWAGFFEQWGKSSP
jgi:glycosyltransferase involved in cell wall biosynthesis